MTADLTGPELLAAEHETSQFDCGEPEQTNWLRRWALTNQRNDSARVYVVHREHRVVGYYALSMGSIARDDGPTRMGQGLAGHPVPVVVLTRLRVDVSEQGRGLGIALVKQALRQASEGADAIGARALLVHAYRENVLPFYEQFDLEPSPTDPLDLLLLMKDLRAALAEEE